MKLVENHKNNYGLNTCLAAIGLPKSTWYYHNKEKVSYEKKYSHLREPIMRVVREHPAYGYRRILPDLEENGHRVGEFVLRRSLNRFNLGLLRSVNKPKPSLPRSYLNQSSNGLNLVKDIKDPAPFQVFYTDFTQIPYANGRKKAYLMPILDHTTKWVTGWALGEHKNTSLALEALSMTHDNLEEIGIDLEDRFIHHDQDPVYTGYSWLQAILISEKAKISFSENGAKGNTYMESFNGRFKGENNSLFYDARNIWELRRIIDTQINYYNMRRRHSALGYLAPWTYINREVTLPEPVVDLALISS